MSVKKHTVLLLEDDPVQVMLFQGMANDQNHSLVSADNVQDALRIFKTSTIAACVVDLGVYRQRRDYDAGAGLDFIIQVRRSGDTGMPILVVSSTRDPAVLVPCFEAGCDDYVLKDEGVEGAVDRLRSWTKALPIPAETMKAKRDGVLAALRRSLKN